MVTKIVNIYLNEEDVLNVYGMAIRVNILKGYKKKLEFNEVNLYGNMGCI